MKDLTVIICTHNPRPDLFARVLSGLRSQDLSRDVWELLLIDNSSDEPLATKYSLDWHPHGRHIREEKLGLTPANLRGVKEAASDTIVFLHDDNILAPDYLRNALSILQKMPWLGAFNGSTIGEYEAPFPEWADNMRAQLAIREISKPSWGAVAGFYGAICAPVGAGMVIRKNVAQHYAKKVTNDRLRQELGRKGDLLISGEDTDMALCACELGYAVGVFPELSLIHVMPAKRLTREYLLKLAEGMGFSVAVLQYIWDEGVLPNSHDTLCLSARLYKAYSQLRTNLIGSTRAKWHMDWEEATRRGQIKARAFILNLAAG